jgi:hypothetical protein
VLFLLGFPHARPQGFLDVQDADYSSESIAANDVSVTTAREYEPVWVKERPLSPATESLTIFGGEGRVLTTSAGPTYYEFQAQIHQQARLRINVFYFPGWVLYVDGVESSIDFSNPQGAIEFSLEPGEHVVQLYWTHTPVRLWSTRVSLLALVLLLLTPWMTRRGSAFAKAFVSRRAKRLSADADTPGDDRE